MTQLDSEVWLEHAREALSPREVDQARVLAALEQRLDLPASDAASAAERSNRLHAAQPTRFGLPNLPAPSTLLRWALRTLVPLAGVAAIGALIATRSAQTPAPTRKPTKPVAAAVTQVSLPDALDRAIAEVEVKADPEDSKPEQSPQGSEGAAPQPNEKKPQRKKCRSAKGTERPCGTTRPATTAVASTEPPTAAAPPASLARELAALREAQHALRNGQAQKALDLLTSFEREVPGPGAMLEERTAAATMARCALTPNRDGQSALYDAFVKRYPKSAYATRLRRSCLPKVQP